MQKVITGLFKARIFSAIVKSFRTSSDEGFYDTDAADVLLDGVI